MYWVAPNWRSPTFVSAAVHRAGDLVLIRDKIDSGLASSSAPYQFGARLFNLRNSSDYLVLDDGRSRSRHTAPSQISNG